MRRLPKFLIVTILKLSIFVGFIPNAIATSFIPTSFETQIRNSSAVVKVRYGGKSYFKGHDGQIYTKAKFKLLAEVGLDNAQNINVDDFAVTMWGGEWNGVVYSIESSPRFEKDEIAYLLLDKNGGTYQIQNLAMGKYSPKMKDGKEILISNLYPESSPLGSISLEKFDDIIQKKFNSKLKYLKTSKFDQKEIYNNNKRHPSIEMRSRKISSIGEKRDNNREKKTPLYLYITLILLITFLVPLPLYILLKKKSSGE